MFRNLHFKAVIKEAVREALIEYFGESEEVATFDSKVSGVGSITDPNTSTDDNNSDNNKSEDESGKGGASEESSGGGTFGDGRPKPDAGVGAFSLR